MSLLTRTLLPLALACALLGGCSGSTAGSSAAGEPAAGSNGKVTDSGALPAQTTETKTGGVVPQSPVIIDQRRKSTMCFANSSPTSSWRKWPPPAIT